jgi:hypothetical protein
LYALEMELLDPAVRADPVRVGDLLRDDFIEFGSSGIREGGVDRDALGEEHARVVIRGFSVRELAEETALVTYRSVGQSGIEARRSSVWVRTDGDWQLVFHQGTRIPDQWGPVG